MPCCVLRRRCVLVGNSRRLHELHGAWSPEQRTHLHCLDKQKDANAGQSRLEHDQS